MKLSKRHEDLIKHTFIDFRQTSEFIKDPVIFTRAKYFRSNGYRTDERI